jgi:uncharacterized protein
MKNCVAPNTCAISYLTGKLFRAGGQDYFWNSSAGAAQPVSPTALALFERFENGFGGCDLPRGDSAAPDLRPHIANPYSSERIAPALSGNLRMLVLETTRNCNLACSYCIDGDAYAQKNCVHLANLTRADALAAIDLLAEGAAGHDKPLIVSFYGGEPLLRFDLLEECSAYARDRAGPRGVLFSVTTNGTLFDDEKVDFLVGNEVSVLVSLDGPRAVHDRFRLTKKGAPTHDRVMKALARIRSRYPDWAARLLRLSIVVMPGADLAGLQEFFDQMRLPVTANFVESYGLEGLPARGQGQPGLAEVAAGLRARMKTHGPGYLQSAAAKTDFVANLLRSTLERMARPGRSCTSQSLGQCLLGTSRLYLAADGALYPCEKLAGHGWAQIGTATTGLDAGRVEEKVAEFYDLAGRKCDGCWMASRCSMCSALTVSGDALSEEKFDHYCEGMRAAGRFALEFNELARVDGAAILPPAAVPD